MKLKPESSFLTLLVQKPPKPVQLIRRNVFILEKVRHQIVCRAPIEADKQVVKGGSLNIGRLQKRAIDERAVVNGVLNGAFCLQLAQQSLYCTERGGSSTAQLIRYLARGCGALLP